MLSVRMKAKRGTDAVTVPKMDVLAEVAALRRRPAGAQVRA
jgi:hypothetical protein